MYGIDKLMKEDAFMYLVPRDRVATVILKRMTEGLKQNIENFVNYDSSNYAWIDELETED